MSDHVLPRIAAPLLLAAAILLSFRLEQAPPPVTLAGGEPPTPSDAEIRSAYQRAIAPEAPGYDRGATRAPVTVVEFADFGCRYCAAFAAETYPKLANEFVKPGLVRWRFVPFVLGMFANGGGAARAGVCAGEQGAVAFGRMADWLFTAQGEWQRAGDPAGEFRRLADVAGLDAARFASCYLGAASDTLIRAANDLADQLGVRATPTFFVNGRRVEGALPVEQFRTVLVDALRQSRGH